MIDFLSSQNGGNVWREYRIGKIKLKQLELSFIM